MRLKSASTVQPALLTRSEIAYLSSELPSARKYSEFEARLQDQEALGTRED